MNAERTPLIAGNWKMNPNTTGKAYNLALSVDNGCPDSSGLVKKVEVVVCPPHLHLSTVANEGFDFEMGAQDLSLYSDGAHTGDSPSGEMIRNIGCKYVIVGHSERRKAGETDETVAAKVKAALRNALSPILCVGESLETRDKGEAEAFVTEQLTKALEGLTAEDMAKVVIAYEPIWAIGKDRTPATPQDAETMCLHIRGEIARLFTQAVADKVRILYGGNVKPENIDSFMAQPDVDGALVGGASLKAEDFVRIVNFNKPEEKK